MPYTVPLTDLTIIIMDKLKVKIILGSTRPNRTSEKVAPWVLEQVKKNDAFDAELLDLREYPMPFYDEATTPSQVKDGAYNNEVVQKWAAKIKEADAFIVIAPEYDHGVPAVLKNSFDHVFTEWNYKPLAFVAYGSAGGARSVEHLRQTAVELHMASVRTAVHIQAPWTMMDEKGAFKPGVLEQFEGAAKMMLEQLLWWGKALKTARNSA
ncbi:MAG TPA: NAD(P)H-dependent oxidoreductase [Candidatus Paceibacterota bacterium]|nr:NAD(P)H-dependent oxidoreductase [Candidatus Paceibacterota bacterium]